jgi:hypothetical protein
MVSTEGWLREQQVEAAVEPLVRLSVQHPTKLPPLQPEVPVVDDEKIASRWRLP